MSVPFVTIITVCYNAEQTITPTLLSVQNQTYEGMEYLVIDGASTDGTLCLVRELAPRAKVYSEPDRGIYDAMNKGLSYAQGTYVWFLNAGDLLPSVNTVAHLAQEAMAQESLPDVLYGYTRLIDQEGRDLGLRRLSPPKQLNWKSFEQGMLVCHQSFIARRSLAPQYDLSYRFSSDFDWCIRVLRGAKAVHRVDEVLSLYLSEGATTANHRRSLYERWQIMCRYYGFGRTLWQHVRFLFIRKR